MQLFIGNWAPDGRFILSEEESHHCIRVTRHRTGDRLLISDLKGEIHLGRIMDENPKQTSCLKEEVWKTEQITQGRITIGISPTQQSDRFEWFLEKSVEAGVHRIQPLICHRTENQKDKSDRWGRIIRSAVKQTLRAYEPQLLPAVKLREWLKTKEDGQRFICHCGPGHKGFLGSLYQKGSDVTVLIGPEGDFSEEEVAQCLSSGYTAADLGSLRLRTETAGLAACFILQTVNNCK